MKKNTIYIGYDLHLNLKLYNLPKKLIKNIKSLSPRISLVKIKDSNDKFLKDIEIYFGNRINDDIIKNSPRLKWIHFGSIGIDRINKNKVVKRKIVVTNSKGTMEKSVATSVLSSILYFARGLNHIEKLRNKKKLTRKSIDDFFENFSDLKNLTCLIVGKGSIGGEIERVCNSMNIKVLSIKKNIDKKDTNKTFSLKYLPDLVKKSDYIVNLLPLTKETTKIFNKKIFSRMKASSIFINVGRGGTVNEEHLISALKSNEIRGAALDVFEKEPLSQNSPLWKIDNLLITPHIAGLHSNYWNLQEELFIDNLKRYLSSKKLINRVNINKEY